MSPAGTQRACRRWRTLQENYMPMRDNVAAADTQPVAQRNDSSTAHHAESRRTAHDARVPITNTNTVQTGEGTQTPAIKGSTGLEKPSSHGESWVNLKFRDANRNRKVRTTLGLAGACCTIMGLVWTACCLLYNLPGLAVTFVGLTAVGLLAIHGFRRGNATALSLVAHGIFVVVLVISFADTPIAHIPRSTHLFFLPLAASMLLAFDRRHRYSANVFPLTCMAIFIAFGVGALDFTPLFASPPPQLRMLGATSSIALSTMLLAAILYIYRSDVDARLSLERELVRAVRNQEIKVLYQPQVSETGKVLGAEALVRWQHPSGTLLTPDKFIPLAEENALIRDIGMEVLRQVCATLRKWSQEPELCDMVVAVNVSPVQLLDQTFVTSVLEVIVAAGVNPSLLELELTESALCVDIEAVREKMHELKAFGIGWALDDFGTGFSSLSMLRTLPVTKLKIDRQFVNDAMSEDSARRLLAKIVEISEVMGMVALAEGIEEPAQCDMLSAMGCRRFQGFLFGRPQSPHDLEQLVTAQANMQQAH